MDGFVGHCEGGLVILAKVRLVRIRIAYCEEEKIESIVLTFMMFTLCVASVRRGRTRNLI